MKFLSFLTQRDVLVLDYQHGRRDVTCKPAIGRPTLNSIRQTDVDTLMIRTQSRVRVFGARKWPIPESYLCPLPSSNLHSVPLPSPCSFLFVREKPWASYRTYHQQFSITPLFNQL